MEQQGFLKAVEGSIVHFSASVSAAASVPRADFPTDRASLAWLRSRGSLRLLCVSHWHRFPSSETYFHTCVKINKTTNKKKKKKSSFCLYVPEPTEVALVDLLVVFFLFLGILIAVREGL